MKFISFRFGGVARWGAVRDDGAVIDLTGAGFGATLREAIAANRLGAAALAAEAGEALCQLGDVTLDSPLPDTGRILAVGANYSDHAAEMNRDVGGDPQFFIRVPSSIVPHGAPILKPRVSDHLDYEGELAIVIGKGGRHIAEEDAMDHVAGYTIFNDGTVRDYQQVSLPVGKNFDASGSIGPWFVPATDISYPLTLETRVNGEYASTTTPTTSPLGLPPDRICLAFCSPGAGRHHRKRHPGRRQRQTQATALAQGGRCARDRDRPDRNVAKRDRQ
jgi:2-keto-4-pentenoate hydratase/2-oxohepta-3-ene-1,7-dioic acid hydratase in catechol pathway